ASAARPAMGKSHFIAELPVCWTWPAAALAAEAGTLAPGASVIENPYGRAPAMLAFSSENRLVSPLALTGFAAEPPPQGPRARGGAEGGGGEGAEQVLDGGPAEPGKLRDAVDEAREGAAAEQRAQRGRPFLQQRPGVPREHTSHILHRAIDIVDGRDNFLSP